MDQLLLDVLKRLYGSREVDVQEVHDNPKLQISHVNILERDREEFSI